MPDKAQKLNVTVIGGGSWGTTIAALVARNAKVRLWARNDETVDEINRHHRNSKYLGEAELPKSVKATGDLQLAVASADVLVIGVPSHGFRETLEQIREHIRPWIPVVSLTKGLETETGKRMTQLIEEILPGHPVGVLTGPNLAREILAGQAAASVIAMKDENIITTLQSLFSSGLFRVYTNDDVVGCELGGVLKNVIAIAVGMGDGMGAGDNTRAALITRGLAEITRLGVALGGKRETFAGLTGMGDLIATCTSPQSRNRHVGVELGKGRSLKEIIDDMVMVAEGVKSAATVLELAQQNNIDVPIVEDVNNVLQGRSTASKSIKGLIREKAGAESEPG